MINHKILRSFFLLAPQRHRKCQSASFPQTYPRGLENYQYEIYLDLPTYLYRIHKNITQNGATKKAILVVGNNVKAIHITPK